MKLLNVGCGGRFCRGRGWTNLDIVSSTKEIIAHNLRTGIPFPDNTFDVVYHSHVMEHIPKADVNFFIMECIRVLRPKGVLRIAIPDLEQIVFNYVRLLNEGIKSIKSESIAADYDWIMIEMYDQIIRNEQGGEMKRYLKEKPLLNREFLIERCGKEVERILDSSLPSIEKNGVKTLSLLEFIRIIYRFIRYPQYRKDLILKIILGKADYQQFQHAVFRQSGEIHQWMYDRYSLTRILNGFGLSGIAQRQAYESYIQDWKCFDLDTEPDGSIYKPDSLYIEAIK